MARWISVLLVLVTALTALSCASGSRVKRKQIAAGTLENETRPVSLRTAQYQQLMSEGDYLKAHMRNGDVYVLGNSSQSGTRDGRPTRQIDFSARLLKGFGTRLDAWRDTVGHGWFDVPLDSVVIFETNVVETSPNITGLAILTGLSLGVTAYCLTNTKACFGSCPTFYMSDGDSLRLQAEGFSSSIAPSLEARDLDALYRAGPQKGTINIEMRNEALETHVVRYVNLLAVPRAGDQRIFKDGRDTLWAVSNLFPVKSCRGEEGDCTASVEAFDGRERWSPADSTDLGTRELVELKFDGSVDRRLGIVVGARQSLMSTYLLYQTFAYMGRDVGRWIAELERNSGRLIDSGVGSVLGNIEIQIVDTTGVWNTIGEVGEHGPLASDLTLVDLPEGADPSHVRLRMTKGNWRLDYVALAEIDAPVNPVRLQPVAVRQGDSLAVTALARLVSEEDALTTLPGDQYILSFQLPASLESSELFLESRGYYLEWIRDEWVKEENPERLMQILLTPAVALKHLAPEFKKAEPLMEEAFWNSRYVVQ